MKNKQVLKLKYLTCIKHLNSTIKAPNYRVFLASKLEKSVHLKKSALVCDCNSQIFSCLLATGFSNGTLHKAWWSLLLLHVSGFLLEHWQKPYIRLTALCNIYLEKKKHKFTIWLISPSKHKIAQFLSRWLCAIIITFKIRDRPELTVGINFFLKKNTATI